MNATDRTLCHIAELHELRALTLQDGLDAESWSDAGLGALAPVLLPSWIPLSGFRLSG
jgi:hypothetical protein